jgi:hypothetical protein
MDGENARAIIRAGPAAKVMRVGIGDDVGGWKVAQIDGRKLVLMLDGRLVTFLMFTKKNASSARSESALQATDNKTQDATPQQSPSPNPQTSGAPSLHRERHPR